MWLGDDAQDDAWVEDDGDREPDGLDSPPYALADEVSADDPDAVEGDWDEDEWADDEWADQPDDAPGRRMLVPAFVLGAVVGMLLLGLVWGATAMFGGSDAPAGRAAIGRTNTDQPSPAAATSAAPPGPTRLERCRHADAELTVPLEAASSAMDQWEVHVGAMNKLVVGAISLQQANDFWNQTRVGAQRHLDRFRAASRVVQGLSCPAPGRVPHASPALRSCVRRVAADQRAFEAAQTTLRTWGRHVKDMEMLRMGHMTPAAATQMWLSSWHRGLQQLHAYRDADEALAGSGRC